MADETTTTTETTETTDTAETTPAIDLSKLDESTDSKADKGKSKEPTVQDLQAEIEKLKLEKNKIKESFDKKAREKADADKKAKEAEEKASEPAEENARLKTELEAIKRDRMKESLRYTYSKEFGVSDDLTAKMVSAIFSDETGEFVEGDFRASQLELIKSVREQARKEGYEERDREIANGKPRSVGSNTSSSPFDDIVNKYNKK